MNSSCLIGRGNMIARHYNCSGAVADFNLLLQPAGIKGVWPLNKILAFGGNAAGAAHTFSKEAPFAKAQDLLKDGVFIKIQFCHKLLHIGDIIIRLGFFIEVVKNLTTDFKWFHRFSFYAKS